MAPERRRARSFLLCDGARALAGFVVSVGGVVVAGEDLVGLRDGSATAAAHLKGPPAAALRRRQSRIDNSASTTAPRWRESRFLNLARQPMARERGRSSAMAPELRPLASHLGQLLRLLPAMRCAQGRITSGGAWGAVSKRCAARRRNTSRVDAPHGIETRPKQPPPDALPDEQRPSARMPQRAARPFAEGLAVVRPPEVVFVVPRSHPHAANRTMHCVHGCPGRRRRPGPRELEPVARARREHT